MTHLPDATLLGDAEVEAEGHTIGTCCNDIDRSSPASSDDVVTSVQISADSRGVQVGGHSYVQTGLPFTKRAKQIVVNVLRTQSDASYGALDDIDEESSSNEFIF